MYIFIYAQLHIISNPKIPITTWITDKVYMHTHAYANTYTDLGILMCTYKIMYMPTSIHIYMHTYVHVYA